MRVAVLSNTAWYLVNFRTNLMKAIANKGVEIVAISPRDEYVKYLDENNIKHCEWKLSASSLNPIFELIAIWRLCRLLKKERIDVLLTYTPKGNIYGALAARVSGVNVINNISGLGRLFIDDNYFTLLIQRLYKFSFQRSYKVFFQNNEDMALFLRQDIVSTPHALRLPGSGVDLNKFLPIVNESISNESDNSPVFLLIARMLWDKGIGEYVDAARKVKQVVPNAKFQLLGFLNADHPSAITQQQINSWVKEGVVEYLGSVKDVIPIVAGAHCVVLPSYYREGVPRSLLEAASMSKPIITTDFQGCRDAVKDGESGFLCRPKDAGDLADKMLQFANLTQEEQYNMGYAGRKKMEAEFDENIVINHYLEVLRDIGGRVFEPKPPSQSQS